MKAKKYTFRLIAMNETGAWNIPDTPLADAPKFGVYAFCEKEATYCCSLSPSSWCAFIENRFIYDIDDEAAHEQAGDLMFEGGHGNSCYVEYIDLRFQDRRFISDTYSVVLQRKEYESEQAMREAAWDMAQEEFSTNGACYAIPIIDGLNTYRDWQREQSARIIPSLPLFHYATEKENRP